jgi:adenylyltransferase/sulfurtransferase
MTGQRAHGLAAGGLSTGEMMRYVRQVLLPGVGVDGQRRLRDARVLMVGAGGLGAPAAIYLAAAGVGHITLADFDRVELSNLHRQPLYADADIGRPKVEAAEETLRRVNPHVHVEPLAMRLDAENARERVAACDVVLDGCDNLATRHIINRACVTENKPFVYGGIHQFEGQLGVFALNNTACYACLFPEMTEVEPPCTCAEAGVLGVLPGIVGSLQAAEAIKLILGIGEPLAGRLLTCDVLGMRFHALEVPRNPACMVCGPDGVRRTAPASALRAGHAAAPRSVTAEEFEHLLRSGAPVTVLDVSEDSVAHPLAPPDAVHIPYHELPAGLSGLSTEKPLVTACALGIRSSVAAALLTQRGFRDVSTLQGGFNALAAARKKAPC